MYYKKDKYIDNLTKYNKILGIVIPTDGRVDELRTKFMTGIHNLLDIKDICTLLINFQYYEDKVIDDILDEIHDLGFKVRYKIGSYDCSKGIPINLITYETANLLNDCYIWLRMDDDIIPGGKTPIIGKSCGQQYMECIHYMLTHDKCGVIVCTGTIGKLPPRNYLGPSPKFIGSDTDHHSFLWTGLGMFLKNFNNNLTPPDSLWCLGGAEDNLEGAYRIANGYYSAKYNHVRAVHKAKTRPSQGRTSESDYSWADIMEDNIQKYIRDKGWNPEVVIRKVSDQYKLVTKDYYLNKGGLDTTNKEVVDNLTSYYPILDDYQKLLYKIKSLL